MFTVQFQLDSVSLLPLDKMILNIIWKNNV